MEEIGKKYSEEEIRREGEAIAMDLHVSNIKDQLRPGIIAVYHSIRDASPGEYVKIEGEPWQLGSGEWVVRFDGKSGGFALANISKVLRPHSYPIFETPGCKVCGADNFHYQHFPKTSIRICQECQAREKGYKSKARKRFA